MPRKRIRFAQNFLINEQLVSDLVNQSKLSENDIVYEIGPGEGVITQYLALIVKQVIAIEIDHTLVRALRIRFADNPKVQIHHADFLQYTIQHKSYKVFAAIPYNLTAEIMRKLTALENPPEEAYLILQEEAAMKFMGWPRQTEFSVLRQPFFEFQIMAEIAPENFEPVPAVQSVLLMFKKRDEPLLALGDFDLYQRFISHGFRSFRKDLKIAYKNVFTYTQWKRLAKDLGFPIKAKPSELKFQQWLGLFTFLRDNVSEDKKKKLIA